jgi:hypothetical protein
MAVRNADGCAPYKGYNYRLRASGPVPIGPGVFLLQAFGSDKSQVDMYVLADRLPETEDFAGASETGPYVQANFQRLAFLYNGTTEVYQGSVVHKAVWNDEWAIPGESSGDWNP